MLDLGKLRSAVDMDIERVGENQRRFEEEKRKQENIAIEKANKKCDLYDNDVLRIIKKLNTEWYSDGSIFIDNRPSSKTYIIKVPKGKSVPLDGTPQRFVDNYAEIFTIIRDSNGPHFEFYLLLGVKTWVGGSYTHNVWRNGSTATRDISYRADDDTDIDDLNYSNLDIKKLEALIEESFKKVYGDLIHEKEIKVS